MMGRLWLGLARLAAGLTDLVNACRPCRRVAGAAARVSEAYEQHHAAVARFRDALRAHHQASPAPAVKYGRRHDDQAAGAGDF